MLTPDQVHPFLQNEDPIVRNYARRYFHDCSTPGPFTADDLWLLIGRANGTDEALSAVADLAKAPQTESSLQSLLAALETDHSELFDDHYQRTIRDLPYGLLAAHRDAILNYPTLLGHVRDHLQLRLDIADEPTPVLWQRLMDHGRALANQYSGAFSFSESDALIDTLGRRGDEAGELALPVLSDPAAFVDWREIFAVKLLGRARFLPAIDALVEKFAIDADVLREEVSRALKRIGTPGVAERIAAFYPGKEWHVRLYAGGPIEDIKLPESEPALLGLLKDEDDPGLRANRLTGLCMLGSLAGLELSRAEIDQDPENGELLYLCEMLLAVSIIRGVELPEAGEWRARIDRRNSRTKRMMASADSLLSPYRDAWRKNGITSPPVEHSPRSALDVIEDLSSRDDAVTPARRDGPKIGRNDPCPCGSGKKYKKCCLNK